MRKFSLILAAIMVSLCVLIVLTLRASDHPTFRVTVTDRKLEAVCYSMPTEFDAKFCDVVSPLTGAKFGIVLVPSGGTAINRE